MNRVKKGELFYFILLILSLIIMLVGMSFSYYALFKSDKKDSTIVKTGTLKINYVDGRQIKTYALLPTNEPNINTVFSVYKKEFSVESTGSLDQTLEIYMNITKNDFTNNALGYKLYDENNNLLSKGDIPKTGSILLANDIFLENNKTKSFTMLIWLKETNENQDYEQGKEFSGGFEIKANQIILK